MTDVQLYHLSGDGVFKPCAAITRACPLGAHLNAEKLQSLGYEVRLTQADQWKRNLQAYANFRKQHDADPDSKAADEAERKLATWVRSNKQAAKGIGTSAWSAERAAAMDAINPNWNKALRKKKRSGTWVRWDERYEQLQAWQTTHGYLPNSKMDDEEGRVLGTWLNLQRQIARGNSKLTAPANQVERLNLIDPEWNKRGQSATRIVHWQKCVGELDEFVSRHRRLPQPSDEDKAEAKLANWIRHQRLKDLTPEQIMQLDAAAPNWSIRRPYGQVSDTATQKPRGERSAIAAKQLTALRTWLESSPDNGVANLGTAPEGLRLWLAAQRTLTKQGRINLDRKAELDSMLPQWDRPLRRGRRPGIRPAV